jgi:hypothetical protein
MTTTKEDPQPNSVNPFNPEYGLLGQLFKQVLGRSTKPTADNKFPPYDALIVPEGMSARPSMSKRLLELFVNSSSKNFSPEEIISMVRVLEQAMPDPEKDPENFARFMQDRCHGVLEMLRLLVLLQSKKAKKADIVSEATALGADYLDKKSGLPRPVVELTGNQRDDVMCSRVGRVRDLCATLDLKASNDHRYPQVVRQYAEFSAPLQAVLRAYSKNVNKFANTLVAPEYGRAQWFSVLLTKLEQFDSESPDTERQFARLEQALNEAKDAEAFMAAINSFGNPIN